MVHVFITQKLKTRMSLFHSDNCPHWSSQRKEQIRFILSKGLDYVSSEDSEDDAMTIRRRPLKWLKTKYHKSLRQLDTIHMDSLSPRAKRMCRKRVDGEPSARPPPENAPDYILSSSLFCCSCGLEYKHKLGGIGYSCEFECKHKLGGIGCSCEFEYKHKLGGSMTDCWTCRTILLAIIIILL